MNSLIQKSIAKTRFIKYQMISLSTKASKTMKRFKTFPIDLFRILKSDKIKLREKEAQKKKDSISYDFTLKEDKLIHPTEGDTYSGPNGMSLRPSGLHMWDILTTFSGKFFIIKIPKDTKLPDDLVLMLEHGDHYSLQTAVSMKPSELNKKLTEFIAPFEKMSKEEFSIKYPLEDSAK